MNQTARRKLAEQIYAGIITGPSMGATTVSPKVAQAVARKAIDLADQFLVEWEKEEES